jgi:hypothetical protein
MLRTFGWAVAALCLAAPVPAAGYSIKTAMTPPPQELKEPIRKLLGDHSVQLLDDKAAVLCELWFRKQLPAKATPAQVKNGLTYREVEETTLVGAARLDQPMTDYRKQKIKPGVYTLRLGFQPMDGDHMGTAPYSEFCLLSPADEDVKPDRMEPKELQELSAKTTGATHPAVFLLYPNNKPADAPKLVKKEADTWVLDFKEDVTTGGRPAVLGFGLTLIGHTASE